MDVPSRYLPAEGTYLVRTACRAVCGVVLASTPNVMVSNDQIAATAQVRTACRAVCGVVVASTPNVMVSNDQIAATAQVRTACRAVCGVVLASTSNVMVSNDQIAATAQVRTACRAVWTFPPGTFRQKVPTWYVSNCRAVPSGRRYLPGITLQELLPINISPLTNHFPRILRLHRGSTLTPIRASWKW
jgi:hypothetical protein